MDLRIDQHMSSPSVRSRREPSKIAQGKRSAALGEGQRRVIRPEERIECSRHRSLNPAMVQGVHTAPPGRNFLGRTLTQGFTLGYSPLLPTGGTALRAPLFPHLELLVGLQAARASERLSLLLGVEPDYRTKVCSTLHLLMD
jgi:hypothetical protein